MMVTMKKRKRRTNLLPWKLKRNNLCLSLIINLTLKKIQPIRELLLHVCIVGKGGKSLLRQVCTCRLPLSISSTRLDWEKKSWRATSTVRVRVLLAKFDETKRQASSSQTELFHPQPTQNQFIMLQECFTSQGFYSP